jgi:hypothetical protein
MILTNYKNIKNNFNLYIAKKCLCIKEKIYIAHVIFLHLKDSGRFILKHCKEPIKYVFQTQYKFENYTEKDIAFE